jgi:hypothetical protein
MQKAPRKRYPRSRPSTHGLQLDPASEALPEHLARLCDLAAEERGHSADPFEQSALEVPGILARDLAELLNAPPPTESKRAAHLARPLA